MCTSLGYICKIPWFWSNHLDWANAVSQSCPNQTLISNLCLSGQSTIGFPGPLTVIVHPQAKVWRSGHLAALTRRRKGLVLHRLQASKLLFLATGWSTGFFKSGADDSMTWAISSACVFFCRGRFDKMMIMEEWKVCSVQVSMAADIQWLQTVFWLWSDFGWMKNSELQLLSYFLTFFTLATSGDPSS